jgi:polyhydroxyalkanoate synthesis regulator phasin
MIINIQDNSLLEEEAMKAKIFFVVLAVVVALVFIGHAVSESADIGGMVKEQEQKITEKSGVAQVLTGSDFDAKIKEQQKLVDHAVSAKTLSKDEAKTVQDNLKRIREKKAAVTKDGKMTEIEQGNLQNMLDRNNRMITDKKHNPVRLFTRPEITHRIANQQMRIEEGVKSGALTKQEAGKLQENLAKAKAKYAELTKDGKFTSAEEEKMHDLLDKDSKLIESKKH